MKVRAKGQLAVEFRAEVLLGEPRGSGRSVRRGCAPVRVLDGRLPTHWIFAEVRLNLYVSGIETGPNSLY